MLARGYSTGGLVGGIADAVNGDNMTVRALVSRGLDRNTASVVASNPALLMQYLAPNQGAQFGVIGEDNLGRKIYGWINPRTQTATPADVAGRGGQGALGGIDTSLTGDAYLAQLDPQTREVVKAIAEGRQQFPGAFALRQPYWQGIVAHLSQYQPGYTQQDYQTRLRTRQDFTSGSSGRNVTSFNTVLGHLNTLDKSVDELRNSRFPYWNEVANWTALHAGDERFQAAYSSFQAAKTAVTDELTRAFRGTGGNVHDIVQWEASINAADSPAALHAAVRQAAELLQSRVQALGDQYNRGMGSMRDPVELLSPGAQATMRRLTGETGSVRATAPATSSGTSRVRVYNPQTGQLE
jgi:hypothetical protein